MKRGLLIAATALSLSATGSYAADMAVKARPFAPAPVAYSWTGCYAGVNAGYVFDATSNQANNIVVPVAPGVLIPTTIRTSEKASGVMVGGQIGCNYQFSNNVVIGSESEIWYQDIRGTSAATPILAPGEFNTAVFKNHFAGATSVRLGYAFDRLLAYGKVGAAFATIQNSSTNAFLGGPPLDFLNVGNNVSIGLLLGGGLEYAVTNRISIKGEYDYIDFGRGNHSLIVSADPGTPIAQTVYGQTITHDREQMFKVGVNYRLF